MSLLLYYKPCFSNKKTKYTIKIRSIISTIAKTQIYITLNYINN